MNLFIYFIMNLFIHFIMNIFIYLVINLLYTNSFIYMFTQESIDILIDEFILYIYILLFMIYLLKNLLIICILLFSLRLTRF